MEKMNKTCIRKALAALTVIAALFIVLPPFQALAHLGATPNESAWQTDGPIHVILKTADAIYLGGEFSSIFRNTGGGVPINAISGQPVSIFPKVDGTVSVCVPDGSGGWYIGGDFTLVGNVARNNIARIRSDGTLHPTWNPDADQEVRALAVSGSVVYVGGAFGHIGGQDRNFIAALDASTGMATSWNPGADFSVEALAVYGSTVYAGGEFSWIGGSERNFIAALDASTGVATSWNPNADDSVYTIVISGSTIYVGGAFTKIGGLTRNYIASLGTSSSSARTWNPNSDGSVYALAVSGSTVYAGGEFSRIGGQDRYSIAALSTSTAGATSWNPSASGTGWYVEVLALAVSPDAKTVYAGGSFTRIGGQARSRLAALSVSTGTATDWNPNPKGDGWSVDVQTVAVSPDGSTVYAGGDFTNMGSQTRNNIAALNATADSVTAWNPNADGPVNILAVSGTTVYAAGAFTNIGGQVRNRLAALDAVVGSATAWNPDPDESVDTLAVSPDGQTLYAGGRFTMIGGQNRNYIAALSTSGGIPSAWNPESDNAVNALVLSPDGSLVYVGGDFTVIGGQNRNRIAALGIDGRALAWNPNASRGDLYSSVNALTLSPDATMLYVGGLFSSIGGQNRNHIAALEILTGNATGWNPDADGTVTTIAATAATVYAAGDFSFIGGQNRYLLAALSSSSGGARDWNPGPDDSVFSLCLSDTSLFVGGSFEYMGEMIQSGFARFDFLPSGELLVTIEPPDALAAGAQWRLAGETDAYWKNSNVTEGDIPPGNYTIEYKEMPGWLKPANQSVAIVGGQTTVSNAVYIPQMGSLKVTIVPDDAINAGAQWRRTGTSAWFDSGQTESGIPVGNYTVEFKVIAGWYAPANTAIAIINGQTTTTNAIYARIHSISTPMAPEGPADANIGQALTFISGGGNCSFPDHAVHYQFLWGDGTQSSWGTSSSQSKTYGTAGLYGVQARTRCALDWNLVSPWSDYTAVIIRNPSQTGLSASVMTLGECSSENLEIPFVLFDPQSRPANIYAQYSLDGGKTWNWAWTTRSLLECMRNLAASPDGVVHYFPWYAAKQATCNLYDQVRIRILPYNAEGQGVWASSRDFCVDNLFQIPWAAVYAPEKTSRGYIPIYYSLVDCTREPTSIYCKYSVDGGKTWNWAWQAPVGGDGQNNLATHETGAIRTFMWNAANNLPDASYDNVQFSILPYNTKGMSGYWKSPIFSIKNAKAPMAALYAPSSPASGPVVKVYMRVMDYQSVSTNIKAWYSTDGGNSWNEATSSTGGSLLMNIAAPPQGALCSFPWDAAHDLGTGTFDNVKFAVRASNAAHGEGEWEQTGTFSVQTGR